MRIAEPEQEKEEEEKRGKERMIFSSSSSPEVRSSRGWGRERGRRYICVCFQLSLSYASAKPIFLTNQEWAWKATLFGVDFGCLESYLTLFDVSDERHAFSINFLIKSVDERASLCLRAERWSYLFCWSAIFLLDFSTCLFFVVYPGFYSLRGFIETICRPYSTLTNSDIIVLDRIFLYPGLMAVTL